MIGAHPDDENTDVLAFLSRGRKARTAYLSLTRGEGGQNLLGAEQNEVLGVIRTQELVAARRIDGAEQYFTRAIDFGFSKSAEDTLAKWGREAVLSDIVWIIRRFRPDVIVQAFAGTTGDGHGHHQASGLLAAEAFEAASDKRRFPEQLNRVEPWRATRLLQILLGPAPRGPAIQIDATEIEPVEGVSYAEIARRSRSMHRSQGFDSPARKVPPRCWLVCLAGEPAPRDIFDHIDTTWNRLPGGAAVGRMLDDIARQFDPQQPEKTVRRLAEVRRLVAAIEDPWAKLKLRDLDEAVAQCRGLSLSAVSQARYVAPGAVLDVSLEGLDKKVTVTVPADMPYSQPYWLRQPHGPYLYTVEDQELVGLAESPAAMSVPFRIRAGDEEIEFERPVVGPGNAGKPSRGCAAGFGEDPRAGSPVHRWERQGRCGLAAEPLRRRVGRTGSGGAGRLGRGARFFRFRVEGGKREHDAFLHGDAARRGGAWDVWRGCQDGRKRNFLRRRGGVLSGAFPRRSF